MTSNQPNARQLPLDFFEGEREADAPNIQPDDSTLAGIEKSALGDDVNSLMEAIVDGPNMDIAWARIKTNHGAAGPDGVTVEDFSEWLAPRWKQIRRQLLDGTYQPSPARRVSIPKPDGGTRNLAIPNLVDRVIQQAIVLILTPIFDPDFSESSFGYRPFRSHHSFPISIWMIWTRNWSNAGCLSCDTLTTS